MDEEEDGARTPEHITAAYLRGELTVNIDDPKPDLPPDLAT